MITNLFLYKEEKLLLLTLLYIIILTIIYILFYKLLKWVNPFKRIMLCSLIEIEHYL